MLTERAVIARVFCWAALVGAAILREWFISIGQRTAESQIGYRLCELLIRLGSAGLVWDNFYSLPVSENDLADAGGRTVA